MQILNFSSTEVLILDAVLTLNKLNMWYFKELIILQELVCLERVSQSKSYKKIENLNVIIKLPEALSQM